MNNTHMSETAYRSSDQVIATNVLTPVKALNRNSCPKGNTRNTIQYAQVSHCEHSKNIKLRFKCLMSR